MRVVFTKHAASRMQQRGLARLQLDLLLDFGTREPAGGGSVKVFMDRAARKRLRAYAGPLSAKCLEHIDVYAIVNPEGHVVTAAHRTERVRRH